VHGEANIHQRSPVEDWFLQNRVEVQAAPDVADFAAGEVALRMCLTTSSRRRSGVAESLKVEL
jgi:hypothetical protein